MHRAIEQDLRRLAASIDELAVGGWQHAPGRSRAIRRYTVALLTEIRSHHDNEDEIFWPVIAAASLQAVDLGPLTDDHQAIAAAVRRVSQALGSLRDLRGPLGELQDMVSEHIADEEQQVFPVIRRYVNAGTYRWSERQARRTVSLTRLRFALPWLARHTRAGELNCLLAAEGWRARILLTASRPGYARLERLAFGSAACSADFKGVAL